MRSQKSRPKRNARNEPSSACCRSFARSSMESSGRIRESSHRKSPLVFAFAAVLPPSAARLKCRIETHSRTSMNGLNDVVEAYESAQARGPAELADFLPAASHPEYREILRELVRVELENGWKRGQPRPLEDYQALYPQLFQDKEETRELAFEEFRLRCQAGLKPSVQEYRQRFQINPDSWPGRVGVELPRASGEMRPGTCEAAWEILERLLKDVQGCDSNDEQLRLVLQGVRDSLGAD